MFYDPTISKNTNLCENIPFKKEEAFAEKATPGEKHGISIKTSKLDS